MTSVGAPTNHSSHDTSIDNHQMQSLQPSSFITFSTILENIDVLPLIVEYIGPHQYRFVATIHHSFYDAYTKVFPDDLTTLLNTSTVELAKYCWDDLMDIIDYWYDGRYILCSSAAKYGNLAALQYLRSKECEWDERTCSYRSEERRVGKEC